MAKPMEISSKYAWHPPHRPPPADPSIAMRVAMMSPLAKCLATALEELLEEDEQHDDILAVGDEDGPARPRGSTHTAKDDESNHHYQNTSDIASNSNNGQSQQEQGVDSESLSTSPRAKVRRGCEDAHDKKISFDGAMSKSILDAYCKAVVETKFDHETNQSLLLPSTVNATTANKGEEAGASSAAPAAMLMGEIDHYNRVGGQWRIVVKNACIKRRSTIQIDNGKTGKRLRKRVMVDWNEDDYNDVDNDNNANASHGDTGGVPHPNSSDVHHFPGTIQILAYDDDT